MLIDSEEDKVERIHRKNYLNRKQSTKRIFTIMLCIQRMKIRYSRLKKLEYFTVTTFTERKSSKQEKEIIIRLIVRFESALDRFNDVI